MQTRYNCRNQHCYITGEYLSPNETEEHIIPNALGGFLKSNKLVLSKINTGLFDRLDAELADRIEIASFFEFKRERGKQPSIKGITKDGIEYMHDAKNFKMASRKPIEAVDEKTGETFLKFPLHQKNEIIKARLRKNPNLNKESIERSIKEVHSNEKQMLSYKHSLNIIANSVSSFRAIAKIATNYAVLNNINKSLFSNLISFIKGELELKHVNLGYFYPKQFLVYEFDSNEISHVLYLRGCQKENLLYCYIELFNLHCFIAILNYNYQEEDFVKSYIWDVRKGHELRKDILLSVTKESVASPFYTYNTDVEKDYGERLGRLFTILNLKLRKD